MAVAVGGAAVLLAACGGSSGPKTTIAGLSANDHGTKDVTGMTTLEVEADNFYFEPTVLKGTPGQHLTLTIKNGTGTQHNFTMSAQSISKDVDAKKTETVSVTFPSTGTLSFFCVYHKNKGMAGGLQTG
jgi:plastocyanin